MRFVQLQVHVLELTVEALGRLSSFLKAGLSENQFKDFYSKFITKLLTFFKSLITRETRTNLKNSQTHGNPTEDAKCQPLLQTAAHPTCKKLVMYCDVNLLLAHPMKVGTKKWSIKIQHRLSEAFDMQLKTVMKKPRHLAIIFVDCSLEKCWHRLSWTAN